MIYTGYCTSGEVRVEFGVALSQLLGRALKNKLAYGGEIPMIGSRIASNRNSIVRAFLSDPRAEWLFMVDTDMTFQPDVLERFLEVADKKERPILGGLCYGMGGEGLFPTLYHFNGENFIRSEGYPDESVVPVDGTGAACLFIHRTVFEKMAEAFKEPSPWFAESVLPGGHQEMGEDMTFCLRARSLGFPIYIHTGIQFGHIKEFEITREFYEAWCRSHRLIVTGTGRCGTGYVSKVLQAAMVPADHERFFNPAHHEIPDWGRADASWMAAPYLADYPDAYIVHLVRHPLRVIESLVSTYLFEDEVSEPKAPYAGFLRDHAADAMKKDTPLERAVAFYLDWVDRIESYASVRLRVEDEITSESLVAMMAAAGSRKNRGDAAGALARIPLNVNTLPHIIKLGWEDVPDEVRARATEFGYKT